MKVVEGTPSVCTSAFYYFVCIFFGLVVRIARAQNDTTPTSEVSALNSIFEKWRIVAQRNQWNISGEPCTGAAIDATSIEISNVDYNPGIKCSCNGTICHITHLKVYALDVVGVIPDELWTLTYLINLNLGKNYLTGPLSASTGNLTKMQYLSLGINALSGELPVELGKLTDLRSLDVSTNDFSGPLPSELGSLSKLEQLYIDSSGVSGAIPSTFATLQNMNTVWASDTELNGSIPDFIGNWSKLTTLRFQGNSFQGQIPSTFSNLTSLTDLRISDLSNGSFSLEFLKNMTSLSTLILRNNNISVSIPSNFGDYQSLSHLDLSFNNLTGQIPDSLFNSSSLTYLFLGSNKLNGTLPAQKSTTLLNIDLSYNELSGSFPSWISQQDLQINLVANNFTIGSSNNSVLPSGLSCLQRNFPCNRNSPIYYNFAIKCGGPLSLPTYEITYEKDNETLGPATYYVSSENRWAVSNVGRFIDSNNPQYTSFSPELLQTARISAGSLRYYGLGLENGNYTLILQFVELTIHNPTTWKSLGRRVFDVYIQGNRVLKDFDIQKEASGASLQVVPKIFTVQVSENYLEIHLFWAGKGTCCVPAQATYGPTISVISATPDFNPTVSNKPPTPTSKTGLIIGIVVPVAVASFLSVIVLYCFVQRRKRAHKNEDEELLGMDARPYTFSYAELTAATEDFNPANKLGEGGFGPVYKGMLKGGQEIAMKLLSKYSKQGVVEFKNEVIFIAKLQHRNLVKLLGYCIQGEERMLVYEYMPNNTLDSFVFSIDQSQRMLLDWTKRFHIINGIARGLLYLHQDSRLRIINRDLKGSNILLDHEMNPKISDFGLARSFGGNDAEANTKQVVGTYGYMSPEYAIEGLFSVKSDVFSFGVMVLETVSGKRNWGFRHPNHHLNLLGHAWMLYKEGKAAELIDAAIENSCNLTQALHSIHVGLLCVQQRPEDRPNMSTVVLMLGGEGALTQPKQPGFFTERNLQEEESSPIKHEPCSANMVTITQLEPR